jgi:hypothetical protein
MDRLSANVVGAALDKRIVPPLRGESWPVCEKGYRVEGWRQKRYLVPAYDIGVEDEWRTINLTEERNLIPDFVSAYRIGLERSKSGSSILRELEEPILDFAAKYGVGISGTFQWIGGPEETITKYAVIMGVTAPIVELLGALLSDEEAAIQDALAACPTIETLELAAGDGATWLKGDGEEFYTDIRERALARVGYIVARSFHKTCLPFSIPQPGARRLDEMDSGWGFSSLAGAMDCQLYQVIIGQSKIARCDYCGALIIGARKGTRFCLNNGKCRYDHDYHSGRRAERDRAKGGRNRPKS